MYKVDAFTENPNDGQASTKIKFVFSGWAKKPFHDAILTDRFKSMRHISMGEIA